MKTELVIYGNNITALVSAYELHKKGADFLWLSPNNFVGGHFRGLQINNLHYDIGMNLLEFSSYNDQNKAQDYNPLVKNDSGRFVSKVESFITDELKINCNEVTQVKLFWQNKILDDFLITDNFSSLNQLSEDLKEKVLSELSQESPLHPRHKNNSQKFLEASFAEVSLANHGTTLHESLIEELCQKITGHSSKEMVARFHRLTWMPLIYPETLKCYLQGDKQDLPKITFHYPTSGSMKEIIDRLNASLTENFNLNKIDSLDYENKNFNLKFENGTSLTAPKLIWTEDILSLAKAAKLTTKQSFDKTSIACSFVSLPTEEILDDSASAFINESHCPFFRYTNYTQCAGNKEKLSRLCLEMNIEGKTLTANEISQLAIEQLKELGIINKSAKNIEVISKIFNNALLLPNFNNYKLFLELQEKITETNWPLHLLGASAGFSSFAFNDQVVQALEFTENYQAPAKGAL